jgi:hypothetical protein
VTVGLECYLTGATPPPTSSIKIMNLDNMEEADVPNPDLQAWKVTDQQVLGFLLSSMMKDVMSQVNACRTMNET